MNVNDKWLKVFKEIAKYAVGAIFGALGLTASGCCINPFFNF